MLSGSLAEECIQINNNISILQEASIELTMCLHTFNQSTACISQDWMHAYNILYLHVHVRHSIKGC